LKSFRIKCKTMNWKKNNAGMPSPVLLYAIAFMLIISIDVKAQGSATHSRAINKNILVIHENARDAQPQHYNNNKSGVRQIVNTNHTRYSAKLSKSGAVRSGNIKFSENTETDTKSLKAKRSKHRSTRKPRNHN